MRGVAKFSADRHYRYVLGRLWGDCEIPAALTWVMLNPSTASASKNDPTIHQCIKLTRREGYDALYVVNLFARRSPDPKMLRVWDDPVGPDCDKWIRWAIRQSATVVLAWGNQGYRFPWRIHEVLNLVGPRRKLCLGLTGRGMPRHPARLDLSTPFKEYP